VTAQAWLNFSFALIEETMEIRTNRTVLVVIVGVILLASASCSPAEPTIAEAAVTQFHTQYNAGQFREIYRQADEAFKDYRKETDFVEMLEAQTLKLGRVDQSKPVRSRSIKEGPMVIVIQDVEFTKGKGTEKFVFRVTGDKVALNNYSVDSLQL
jgi:hypothetical protein